MEQTKILDGKWLASVLQAQIRAEVDRLKQQAGRVPGLGVILVGDNPASHAYVSTKERVAVECGFAKFDYRLPADTTYEKVLAAIRELNADSRVDGILLQLPLPKHIDANKLLDQIDPHKDADGLHPYNQGLLQRGQGLLRPCTPMGAMKLLDLGFATSETHFPAVDLTGMHAVVVGRSILVGKPIAALLLERNATVTIAHSKTKDLPAVCRSADVLVAAVGVPNLVKADWVKPGAIVLDVGINRLPNGKLTGDVDFEAVKSKCRAITPVPKGVGPMTVCMLMQNTLLAFKSKF